MNERIKFFMIVGVIVVLVAGFGLYASVRPQVTTGQEVSMVQPCGWAWCVQHDTAYADINEKNAHANEMNAHANEMNAHAELYKAQANQIRLNSTAGRAGGLLVGAYTGGWLVCLSGVGILFLLVVVSRNIGLVIR